MIVRGCNQLTVQVRRLRFSRYKTNGQWKLYKFCTDSDSEVTVPCNISGSNVNLEIRFVKSSTTIILTSLYSFIFGFFVALFITSLKGDALSNRTVIISSIFHLPNTHRAFSSVLSLQMALHIERKMAPIA